MALAPIRNAAEIKSVGADHSGRYIPTLDGWRAIAIFWVIFSHNQILRIGRLSDIYLTQTGDHGVQLFFALSGMLICGLLLREERDTGSISLRGFYTRRVLRIQPAALLYLFLILMLGLLGFIPNFWQGVVGAVLMIRNFWPGESGTVYWYTSHFWSLAVEEHFYMLLPAFLVLVRRYRLSILSVLVIAFEFWRIYVLKTPRLQEFGWFIYLRTDMVIGGILLGSAFAVALGMPRFRAMATKYLQPWIALLYALAVLVEQQYHHSTYDHLVLMTIYPIVITATMLHPETIASRVLELPPLRFVGRISYSLYLYQQIFFYEYAPPAPGTLRSHVLLCWLLLFALATTSYYIVERPLIRLGHKLSARFKSSAASASPATQTL